MNFIKRNKMKNGQPPWVYTIGDKDLKKLNNLSAKELNAYLSAAKRLAREGIFMDWEPAENDIIATFYNPKMDLNVYAWYEI